MLSVEFRDGGGGFWHVKGLWDVVRGKVSGERGSYGTLKHSKDDPALLSLLSCTALTYTFF